MTGSTLDAAEERALLERLKRGDQRAFSELVTRFQATVYNVVLRILGHRREDALDVSQEVFVTVFKHIKDFRGDSRLSTWIHRIAINHCRTRLAYLARRREALHEPIEEHLPIRDAGHPLRGQVPTPESAYIGNEAERFVRLALAALEPDAREVVVLRDLEGLSYEEIAVITGLKVGTVKSRISRGREALEAAYLRFRGER